jgi:antitoxin FitA
MRAAENGRSMEQEIREILNGAVREKKHAPKSGAELVKRIREIFGPLGGIDLEPLPREPMGEPEWLKDWKD